MLRKFLIKIKGEMVEEERIENEGNLRLMRDIMMKI